MKRVRRPADELVQALVSDLRPVPRAAVALRLSAGVVAGSIVSAILLLLTIGARHDITSMVSSGSFLLKAGYMVATAGIALVAAARLARPDSSPNILWLLPLPLLLFLPVAALELARTDSADWLPLVLGVGWQLCTWLVLLLSIPIYVGLWWAFRSFAPTRMEAAGAVTGLSATAMSAVVYMLHCPTDSAVFAFVWYTLAFAIAAVVGRFTGRQLLRW